MTILPVNLFVDDNKACNLFVDDTAWSTCLLTIPPVNLFVDDTKPVNAEESHSGEKDTNDKVTKYILFLVLLILSSLLTICFLRSIESFPFGIPVRTRLILYDPVRYWGNKESLYFVHSLNSA